MQLKEVISYAKENIVFGNYNNVISLLEKYKLIYKKNKEILLELGKAYFLSDEKFNAKKNLNALLKFDRKNIYAMDLLAKICLKEKKISKTIKILKNIIKIDRFNISAQKELINVYLNSGKYFNIIKCYENKLIKTDILVYYAVSLSYIYLNKKDKALEIIKKFFNTYNSKSNNITKNEIFNIARAFVSVDEYYTVVKLCNLIDVKKEFEEINHFYNTIHFSLSKYLQNLRIGMFSSKNNKFLNICDNLLDKIPRRMVKIRNIILNEKEIYEKQIFLRSKPRYATFVLTTKCNLKCKMCKQSSTDWYMNDKQIEQIKKLIPYLQYVTWHGGEVFFHKKFWELFKFSSLNDVEQEIITNGTLIEDWMINEFLNSKLQLTLSIDAVNKRDYESIRVGASFDKLINLLEKLRNKKNRVYHRNFILKLNVIISKINYKNLYDFIDFANRYNISKIYFFPLNNMDFKSFYDEYFDIINYLDKNIDKIIKKAKSLGVQIETNMPTIFDLKTINNNYERKEVCNLVNNDNLSEPEQKDLFCVVPWQRIRIDEQVIPYCFCKKNVGRLNEDFNILRIWNNKGMRKYREMIKNNNHRLFCNINCLEVSSKIRKEFEGIILE